MEIYGWAGGGAGGAAILFDCVVARKPEVVGQGWEGAGGERDLEEGLWGRGRWGC